MLKSKSKAFIIAATLTALPLSVVGARAEPPSPSAPDFSAFNSSWETRINELSQSPDPHLSANKRLVLGFLFGLVRSAEGQVDINEVAETYLAADYIQHDPNVPTGRDGFVQWFKAGAMTPDTPTAPKVDMSQIDMPTMVTVVAEGDFVTTVSHHMFPDPTKPGSRFDWFHLAVFRVENGKLVEHWNEGLKGAYWCRLKLCYPTQ